MDNYVLWFDNFDDGNTDNIGGKGKNLVELAKGNFPVPSGFFITTKSYKKFIENDNSITDFINELNSLTIDNLKEIKSLSINIRKYIENIIIPDDIVDEIKGDFEKSGADLYYAVRSSATAEDLKNYSFAGQQDAF